MNLNDELNVFIIKCLQGCLVKRGNKQRALKFYMELLEILRSNTKNHPLMLIRYVLETITPSVNLWTKKAGGTSYKLPYLISEKKAFSIAIHWLVHESYNRPERSVSLRLGGLILECLRGRNSALIKKKNEIHKLALFNRAFMHLQKKGRRRSSYTK